jgi:hypothetical protein
MCADEVSACRRQNDDRQTQTQAPEPHLASPELCLVPPPGSGRRTGWCSRTCHGIEVSAKNSSRSQPLNASLRRDDSGVSGSDYWLPRILNLSRIAHGRFPDA